MTKELYLTNGMAGIEQRVQWENKFTLLHKNFDFSNNAVRNFNPILEILGLFQLSINLFKRNLDKIVYFTHLYSQL